MGLGQIYQLSLTTTEQVLNTFEKNSTCSYNALFDEVLLLWF